MQLLQEKQATLRQASSALRLVSKSDAEVSDLQRRVRELEQHLLLPHYPARTPPETPLSSRNESALYISSNLSIQAYFLDSALGAPNRIPDVSATVPVPREISVALGGEADIQRIAATYFQTVHFYLPFVSNIKIVRHIQSVEGSLKPDVALLLLCMKLAQEVPDIHNPHSFALYDLAKDFSAKLCLRGIVSLRALQANILLLLYEIGHAIFPAAFMTVGACARQGIVLGLSEKIAPQLAGKAAHSWLDVEERRRAWWTVVILDRYVALGGRCHALCTEDPASDTPLPADDGVWNNGQIVPPELLPLSSKTSPIGMIISPFARVAQASHLLGQVIRHCDDGSNAYSDLDDIDYFNHLSHEIYTLIDILHNQDAIARLDVTVARTLCFSALFKLANHYYNNNYYYNSSHDPASPQEQHDDPGRAAAAAVNHRDRLCRSVEIIDDICGQVSILIGEIRALLTGESMKLVSPLFLSCFYLCARNLAWMLRETDDLRLGAVKGECVDLLALVESRWRVAGVYLELLKISDSGPDG
ncbi:hypothetical protein HK57_00508 [Aspergillus ustus]|uniref:Xylanolytic transcriptional activator regulatory domain-containing protein n=1 Tax=Aspergillus ustus TaxID=40382 RepID=A0A0C1E6G8_ASPUT|nr:hypothetical protein HK57_00508 [Aspergillus ustus]